MKKDDFVQYAMSAYKPAENMIKMVPADKLDWKPGPNFMTAGQLIYHLSGGIAGELRMCIENSWPKGEMSPTMTDMPSCNSQEALAKLSQDQADLKQVLAGISEEDFATKTVSVPWGWKSTIEVMALNFRDHFQHHKMQLFLYLKLLGLPVNTETLYMG